MEHALFGQLLSFIRYAGFTTALQSSTHMKCCLW